MTEHGALANIYETYSEDRLVHDDDGADDEFIERLLRIAGIQDEEYAEIQRQFGWDDTH